MRTPSNSALVALYLSILAPIAAAHRGHHHNLKARQDQPYPSDQPGYSVPPPATTAVVWSLLPSATSVPLPTAPAGATPYPGAPAIPSWTYDSTKWPVPDQIPPTDSPQVKEWMKELDGHNIPAWSQTTGDCATAPQAVAEAGADKRCWWTCGGCLRSTDISDCNAKRHWGLTFDDGPTDQTPKLLTYLNSKNLKATFFMVGSRVVYNPAIAQYQHLTGHELAVHTWSHPQLTNLTNEQIVAELGWTREVIKNVTGVTPLTMRPPTGDIDDRVRAISMAMGLTPVLWHGAGDDQFDTNDWRVAGGQVTGAQSVIDFDKVLDTVDTLPAGFVVLEHDAHPQTVDLAIGTHIPEGLKRGLTLEAVHTCLNKPLSDSYRETAKSVSYTPGDPNAPVTSTGGSSGGSGSTGGTGSKPGNNTADASVLEAPMVIGALAAFGAMLL